MDKFEFNIKVDEIKKLASKKMYKEAAKVAESINWQKVKDWSLLAMMINIEEAVGDLEEARDMAVIAYNRNLGGRKLLYKLTEILIKINDLSNAEELFKEYEKVSQHDVNRYILLYKLKKAKNASDNELILTLEEYKDHEIDEKYMYELAKLYAKTGRRDECIKTCNDIIMWFQDGDYVERTIKLKQDNGAMLTASQKQLLEKVKNKAEDIESTRELQFIKQQELARLRADEINDAFEDDANKQTNEYQDIDSKVENFLKDEEANKTQKSLIADGKDISSSSVVLEPVKEDVVQADISDTLSTKPNDAPKTEEVLNSDDQVVDKKSLSDTLKIPKVSLETSEEGSKRAAEGIDKASLTLKELIANAKKKIQDNCEQINKEQAEDDIRVVEPDFSLYNTQNIQNALAESMSKIMQDEADDMNVLRPQPKQDNNGFNSYNEENEQQSDEAENYEDDQIEGQMNLEDWLETVREEKYGKQNTREFSKSELDKMLDEREKKSAAYEELIEKQKAIAMAKGTEFDEEQAKQNAKASMILQEIKTDLAIRTGKAAAKLEEAFSHLQEAQQVAADNINEVAKEEDSSEESLDIQESEAQYTVTDEILSSVRNIMKQQETSGNVDNSTDSDNNLKAKTVLIKQTENKQEPKIELNTVNKNEKPEQRKEEKKEKSISKLSPELERIFRKYKDMPGLEAQLYDYFSSIDDEMKMTTSSVGNIIISGNSSSDKTDLARSLVRAINYLYPDNPKKIAKTTGESINHRGIVKAMDKLQGTALIIEGAGSIQPKRINEILNCLDQNTNRMIVIFADSDTEMNVLLNFNPELENKFNHRIVLKQYTVNELVDMARTFARKRQYELDDDALLQLYLRIDKLHGSNENIKLDDIKEIINKAIMKSEKRASHRFFGGIKKKRGENGDIFILTESDFKD